MGHAHDHGSVGWTHLEAEQAAGLSRVDAWWDLLGRPVGARIADVGCGPGLHAVRLAELGADVLAVEVRPDAVSRIPRRPNVTPMLHDLQVAPLPERIDIAVLADVVHHARDPAALLANLRLCADRVLVAESVAGGRGARLAPQAVADALVVAGFEPAPAQDTGDGRFVVVAR